jgi:hypothetical protein
MSSATHGGQQGIDGFRTDEADAPGKRDTPRRLRFGEKGITRIMSLLYGCCRAPSGSTETPRPEATMQRMVPIECPRRTSVSGLLTCGQASSTWSRKQLPAFSSNTSSPATSSGAIRIP